MSKVTKYADRIFLDDKKVEAAKKVEAVEDAQNEVENAIYGAKRALRAAEKRVQTAESATPYNVANELIADLQLEEAQDNLSRLESKKASMF